MASFVRVTEKCQTVTIAKRSDQSKDDFLLSYHKQLSTGIIALIKSLLHSENAFFNMHVVTFLLRDRYAVALSLSYLLNEASVTVSATSIDLIIIRTLSIAGFVQGFMHVYA